MNTIHAIFENGVFRPTQTVALPEQCEVEFKLRIVNGNQAAPGDMTEIYDILSRRPESDDRTAAERHDEHQP